jgi:hypothetical protein
MTDQSGDLSPSTSPVPQSTPQPQTFEQRRQAQERMHMPPPRQRQPQAPNPNAARDAPPGVGKNWGDAHTVEGRHRIAAEARRAETLAADGAPNNQTARDTGAAPSRGNGAEPKYKIGGYELSESEAAGLMERHALEESRKLTMPAEPSGYALELPKDFVTPQGIEFQFFENDPAVALAREFAHKNGFSQEQFSAMSAIYATTRIQEITALNNAVKVEIGKLGAAGTARVTAVQGWLNAVVGPELGAAMNKAMFSAAVVQGFEKLMRHVTSQGGGTFQPGREAPKSNNGDIPNYATMTFEQRRAAQERGAGRR